MFENNSKYFNRFELLLNLKLRDLFENLIVIYLTGHGSKTLQDEQLNSSASHG